MSKTNKQNNTKIKSKKGAVIGLSVGLALAIGAGVAAPLIILNQKKPGESTTYTVKFHTNCSATLNDQIIVKGNHATNPAIQYTGHSLKGWYTNSEFTGNPFNFNTPINSDLDLYASWSKDEPTTEYRVITFIAGEYGKFEIGGKAIPSTQTIIKSGEAFKYATRPTWISKNEEYTFKEWQDSEGNPIDEDKAIESDITINAATKQNILTQTIHFTINQDEGSITDGSSSMNVKKHTKFGVIKKPTVKYKDNSKEFSHWGLITSGSIEPIDDNHEINSNETYIAVFKDIPDTKHRIILEVIVKEPQQVKSGSLKMDFTYEEGTKAADMPTFGSFNKPELTEEGKVFSGWYKDEALESAWSDSEHITPSTDKETAYSLYAKFEEPVTNPIISFQTDTTSEHTKLTWVGNQVVKCEVPVNVDFNTLIKPMVYSNASGDPTTGYSSDYYLTGWYTKDEAGKQIDVPEKITSSIIIYPKFAAKPKLTFSYDEKTEEVAANPSSAWEDVKTPSDVTLITGSGYFGYWEGKDEDDKAVEMKPDTSIDSIDIKKPITPHYFDQYNQINFGDGVLTDLTTSVTTKYEGTSSIGVNREQINYLKDVNKPIPLSNDTTYPNVEFVKWQFSTDNTNWSDIDADTNIPVTAATTQYYVRPVFQQKWHITYDANGGTFDKIGEKEYKDTYVSSSDEFGKIFKPSVSKKDCQFMYWAIKKSDTEYQKVTTNTKFKNDETLYAMWESDKVARKVEFRLTEADAKNTDFPATITGTSYVKNAPLSEKITFGSIPKAYATKHLYKFEGWYKDEELKTKIPDDYVLPTGETPLIAYAKFSVTPEEQYWKLSIQHDPSYELSNDIVYVQNGKTLDIQTGSHDINGIIVKCKGKEVCGWKDADGNSIENVEILKNYDNIYPEFKDSKRQIILRNGGDDTILGFTDGDTIDIPVWDTMYQYIKNLKPTKADFSEFNAWCIKTIEDGTEVFKPITEASDIEVGQNIEIYPQFLSKADFAHSSLPYYWDTKTQQWFAILQNESDDPDCLLCRNAITTDAFKVPKKGFNEKIYFGDMMTSIPNRFLQGCTDFNNGGETLVIPEDIITIGDDFLYGCTSFNVDVDIHKELHHQSFKIGENFMRECVNFNKNIDLHSEHEITTEAKFIFKNGFLFDCYNAKSTVIDITGYNIDKEGYRAEDLYFALSTSYGPDMLITVLVSNTDIQTDFNTLYPIISDPVWRNIDCQVKE